MALGGGAGEYGTPSYLEGVLGNQGAGGRRTGRREGGGEMRRRGTRKERRHSEECASTAVRRPREMHAPLREVVAHVHVKHLRQRERRRQELSVSAGHDGCRTHAKHADKERTEREDRQA